MEIIESEAHREDNNSTRGEGWSKQVCLKLKLFLEGMVSGARRNWERQGIPNVWTGRSEPARAKYSADMWNTEFMCTRRAKDTQRNIGTNEGWQIWWGYGVEWLKSQEGNFEMNSSRDWKPVEVFQKGAVLDRDLEHVTTRASVFWILCMRDRFLFEMSNRQALA